VTLKRAVLSLEKKRKKCKRNDGEENRLQKERKNMKYVKA
jgi:hypothetical protein